MDPRIFPPLIILALIIVLALVAIPAFRLRQKEFKRTGKHPKGYYMGMGLALGMVLGIPIGVAMGNIALGPAMGLPIGVAIGISMEKKHEKELRPLSAKEKAMQKKMFIALLASLSVGVLAFFYVTQLISQ